MHQMCQIISLFPMYRTIYVKKNSQNWHARKIQVRSNHSAQIIRNTHGSAIKNTPQAIVTLLYNLFPSPFIVFCLFASHFHVCFFTYVQLNLSHMSLYSNTILILALPCIFQVVVDLVYILFCCHSYFPLHCTSMCIWNGLVTTLVSAMYFPWNRHVL